MPERLVGDPTRLRQALLNLASNAVKFTQQGHVAIRVLTQSAVHDTLRLQFEVEDTGIGLDPEQVSRLFQPFEQGDASTTRHFGGTGLGLAITRRLAQLMGGEVGVRSTCSGSLFWFTALLAPAAQEAAPPKAAADPLARLRATHAGRHVLLVDDDEVNREVACAMLDLAGLRVTTASDGQAAVSTCLAERFDAVLMDLFMPGVDGLDATRQLRAAGLQLPILAMTASAFDEDRARCLQAGMTGFVPKPFDPAELYAALLQLYNALAQRALTPGGQAATPATAAVGVATPAPKRATTPFPTGGLRG